MNINITLSKSKKDMDVLVSFMENMPNTRLVTTEIHKISTPDNSVENIKKWLSSERKIEYAQKLNEALSEYTFSVEEISISENYSVKE